MGESEKTIFPTLNDVVQHAKPISCRSSCEKLSSDNAVSDNVVPSTFPTRRIRAP